MEKEDRDTRERETEMEKLESPLGSETQESSEESCLPCIILSKSNVNKIYIKL